MSTYPGGWVDLQSANPQLISDKIAYAAVNDGSTTDEGEIKKVTDFHSPTGGTWTANPVTISSQPSVYAVSEVAFVNELMKASAMNQQTQMANLNATLAPPLQNLIYLYGNPAGGFKYQVDIPFDVGGAPTISKLQLSVLENAATQGDQHGEIEVYEITPTNPLSSTNTLYLFFSGFFGLLNIGLRMETSTSLSYMMELKTIILPSGGVK